MSEEERKVIEAKLAAYYLEVTEFRDRQVSREPRKTVAEVIAAAIGNALAEIAAVKIGDDARLSVARAVLSALGDIHISEHALDGLADGSLTTCDGYCHEFCE